MLRLGQNRRTKETVSEMRQTKFSALRGAALAAAVILAATAAIAEPRHGIAMYGDPSLPPDFVSLPQACLLYTSIAVELARKE